MSMCVSMPHSKPTLSFCPDTQALGSQIEARLQDYLTQTHCSHYLSSEVRQCIEDTLHRLMRLHQTSAASTASHLQFICLISHETLNCLQSIMGFCKLLATRKLPAEQQAFYQRIVQRLSTEIRHLSEYILYFSENSMIDFESFSLQRIFINDLIKEALSWHQLPVSFQELHFETNFVADLYWEIEPVRFQQIIRNLLGNACKFSQQGAIALSTGRASDREWICIADTGPGIPLEYQSFVFGQLQQPSEQSGLGLGLGLVQQLCQQMGLQLQLKSKPGEGSSYWIICQLQARSSSYMINSSL